MAEEMGMFITFQAVQLDNSFWFLTPLDIPGHKCESEGRHVFQLGSEVLLLQHFFRLLKALLVLALSQLYSN